MEHLAPSTVQSGTKNRKEVRKKTNKSLVVPFNMHVRHSVIKTDCLVFEELFDDYDMLCIKEM